MKNSMTWGNIVCRAAPLLVIIVLISYFAGGGWSAIPSALVAWGTILLAYATFRMIRNSNEQEESRREEERRIREEEREREFRKRSIDGIIDWALSLTNPRFKIPLVITEEKPWIAMPELEQIATKNIWINNVAKIFGNDFLSTAWKATQGLDEYVSTLDKWFSNEVKLGEVSKAYKKLEISLKELLEFAFVIKANERL